MDTAIIELARSGDEEAFVQIYEHFSPQLHRYVIVSWVIRSLQTK